MVKLLPCEGLRKSLYTEMFVQVRRHLHLVFCLEIVSWSQQRKTPSNFQGSLRKIKLYCTSLQAYKRAGNRLEAKKIKMKRGEVRVIVKRSLSAEFRYLGTRRGGWADKLSRCQQSFEYINNCNIVVMQLQSENEGLLINQPANERIQRARLEKEHYFLKQLQHPYVVVSLHEIVIQKILDGVFDLSIYIPEKYPFEEPSYSTSDNPARKELVSNVIQEWLPKFKILQLVELLSKRISLRKKQQIIAAESTLYRAYQVIPSTTFLIALAILLRVLVAIGPYSGMAHPPNYGDFQAHRNWMSITLSRPVANWYEESESAPWWRIDYPPVAAYLSYVLGSAWQLVEPKSMLVQRGYQSDSLKAFMRLSSLLVELSCLFPPIVLLLYRKHNLLSDLTIFICLLRPDIILIDHGHFQYNSLILGLILWAYYFAQQGRYYMCCILFTISLHAKQMAVYYALAFFSILVGLAIRSSNYSKRKIAVDLLLFALIVLTVSLIIWAPWIGNLTDLSSVVTAIFPIHRGLYQLKVPNFWCISDIIFKWQFHLPQKVIFGFCFAFSILFSAPAIVALILNPNRKIQAIGFLAISLTFFMFSYHVHEKSILLPLLMTPFVSSFLGGWLMNDLIVAGCAGMFHLLKEDQQQIGYFVVLVIYLLASHSFIQMQNRLKAIQPSKQPRTMAQTYNQSIDNLRFRKWIVPLVLFGLHIVEKFCSPPYRLPYLYHLLFASVSFMVNLAALVLLNGILIEDSWKKLKSYSAKQN